MSMTSTEPVEVPVHLQIVGVILRLANDLFYAEELLSKSHLPEKDSVFKAWLIMRATARRLCERGALQLSLGEAWDLRDALKFCPRNADFELIYRQRWNERG